LPQRTNLACPAENALTALCSPFYDTLSRTGASVKANREAMAEYQHALATGRRFKF
jgi:hypothetical protein